MQKEGELKPGTETKEHTMDKGIDWIPDGRVAPVPDRCHARAETQQRQQERKKFLPLGGRTGGVWRQSVSIASIKVRQKEGLKKDNHRVESKKGPEKGEYELSMTRSLKAPPVLPARRGPATVRQI